MYASGRQNPDPNIISFGICRMLDSNANQSQSDGCGKANQMAGDVRTLQHCNSYDVHVKRGQKHRKSKLSLKHSAISRS
jgi:hypothetical protein